MSRLLYIAALAVGLLGLRPSLHGQETQPNAEVIRAAVERSLAVLELASAGSANQRSCFTCHSQALPVFAFAEAQRHGVHISRENFQRQIQHTYDHLERGLDAYTNGKGQGGGVDTAGYALWTLEEGQQQPDRVTTAVVSWLLKSQQPDGHWKRSSFRPPSEASHFATTYLAMRGLQAFASQQQTTELHSALQSAEHWLNTSEAKDTEDRVFQLLGLHAVSDADSQKKVANILLSQQHEDGGWSQLDGMDSDAYATSTALYALHYSGNLDTSDSEWQRGIEYLLATQRPDGTWLVQSRSKPFQPYYETGFPHRADQFISSTATAWASLVLLRALPEAQPATIEALSGTKTLDWPEADLSQRMMLAAHGFVESQIANANKARKPLTGDAEARAAEQRQQLMKILGVVDERIPPRMEYFGDTENPAILFETDDYQVFQVRWSVFANVQGEGLWIRQRGRAHGHIVLVPDADQDPEDLFGFSHDGDQTPLAKHIGRQLAENGFNVIIPAIVSRGALLTADPRRQQADYTQREWIYRQAFHMGRHVIGYDLQRVLAAIDWLQSYDAAQSVDAAQSLDATLRIGIAGYGEGGLLALHAAAIDPRIETALVSGYFDSSDAAWNEPIYRNIWSRLLRFGNAEVASLIAPRKLMIEYSDFPAVKHHKGELSTPLLEKVRDEFDRIPGHDTHCVLVHGPDATALGPYAPSTLAEFCSSFGHPLRENTGSARAIDRRAEPQRLASERALRCLSQLETHVQNLILDSDRTRDASFLNQALPESTQSNWSTDRQHAILQPEGFINATKAFRRDFQDQALGRFDAAPLPANARTRKIAETEAWTAYDVVLDVYSGLFSWGVLVIPKNLQPNQKYPVVVCQHGRGAVPRDTLDAGSTAYNDFAAKLAERGFITFAPFNLYRGEDQYRWLDRKANAIGCTLFSFIVAQHRATLDWLATLPCVDPKRIAFYGLSYGGETAMRVPAVLEQYSLSICSGDFNQWTRKVAATNEAFSFMNTIEWEMPYWNLGNTFDYAEMAYLIFPRPFMVERGHHDRVGRDPWVAYEFAKVRWLYAQFGMADRVAIEYFQGGHSINAEQSFEFLDRFLREP